MSLGEGEEGRDGEDGEVTHFACFVVFSVLVCCSGIMVGMDVLISVYILRVFCYIVQYDDAE